MAKPTSLNREETANQPAEPDVAIRRFYMPDLSEMGVWLVRRLRERFPHLNEGAHIGWLRGCMESNDILFIRTERAVALAQRESKPLSTVPEIQVVFALCNPDKTGEKHLLAEKERAAQLEGAALYGQILTWAKHNGCAEIKLTDFNDVPMQIIRDECGNVFKRDLIYVKVRA